MVRQVMTVALFTIGCISFIKNTEEVANNDIPLYNISNFISYDAFFIASNISVMEIKNKPS